MKGLTIDEIAEELGIPWKTAHKRIETLGIKPLSYKALYAPAVVETIRNVPGKGRPKKAVENVVLSMGVIEKFWKTGEFVEEEASDKKKFWKHFREFNDIVKISSLKELLEMSAALEEEDIEPVFIKEVMQDTIKKAIQNVPGKGRQKKAVKPVKPKSKNKKE